MEWSTNAEIVNGENKIISLLREMIENQEKMINLLNQMEKEKKNESRSIDE